MATFAQRMAARESVEANSSVVPDGLELPAESVEGTLADIEHDTRPIEANDADHDTLAADADETEAQLDNLDEAADAAENADEDKMEADEDMSEDAAEALDVAQESIRRRWNFNHRQSVARESYGSRNRRQVARESLWEDIKAFLGRIRDWLKEQGRKLKDRWLKFKNMGKTIQARSKKFDAVLRKLSKKKKDDISGSFIKQLTADGKFIGTNVTELKRTIEDGLDFYAKSGEVTAFLTELVNDAQNKSAELGKKIDGFYSLAAGAGSSSNVVVLDNSTVVVKIEGEDFSVSMESSEKDIESDIPTPATNVLMQVNSFYGNFGKQLEKHLQAYQKTEANRTKYENAIDKLLQKVDKIKLGEDQDLATNVRNVRKIITDNNSLLSVGERVMKTNQACLIGGLNGLLIAGIAAYEKSKS